MPGSLRATQERLASNLGSNMPAVIDIQPASVDREHGRVLAVVGHAHRCPREVGSGLQRDGNVPPAGFEPAHHAPEACALSPELRGPFAEVSASAFCHLKPLCAVNLQDHPSRRLSSNFQRNQHIRSALNIGVQY